MEVLGFIIDVVCTEHRELSPFYDVSIVKGGGAITGTIINF